MAKRNYRNWLMNEKYERDPRLIEKDREYYRGKRSELLADEKEEKWFSFGNLVESLVGKAIKTKKKKDILEAEKILEKASRNDWL